MSEPINEWKELALIKNEEVELLRQQLAQVQHELNEAKKDAERYREALESVANSNYMPIGLIQTIRAVLYNQAMREGE